MTSLRRLLPVVLAVAVSALALSATPAGAATPAVWLCNPVTKTTDPCRTSLTATIVDGKGKTLDTEHHLNARKPPVDCFYVYPTVSGQQTDQADLTIDPEQRAIARYQASRYSETCRVFAPMYRQLTLLGLLEPDKITPEMRASTYQDVVDAWHQYLSKYNRGRGVIFIGHSQGSFVLRQLLHDEVDPKPSVLSRLVAADLIGGNVLVAKGKDVGGDFKHIPACHTITQVACVIAYSSFNATPPAGALFGRPGGAGITMTGDPAKNDVLCVNPANLRGGKGLLLSYQPTSPFPGVLGTLIPKLEGPLPKVSTPWIEQTSYFARCSSAANAHVLQVTATGGARKFVPQPDATWGLHLADMNVAMGNLVLVSKAEAAAFVRGAP